MHELRRRLPGQRILLRMLALTLTLLAAARPADSSAALQRAMQDRIARDSGAVAAVVLRDPVSGLRLALTPALRFHAASTMKLGVLLELGRRIDAGELGWDDS